MPRPKKLRRVFFKPEVYYFKPQSVPLRFLEEVILTHDEIEALRLVELEEMSQEKASEIMNISQPTLSRILNSARKKIADAIINGKAIRINTDL